MTSNDTVYQAYEAFKGSASHVACAQTAYCLAVGTGCSRDEARIEGLRGPAKVDKEVNTRIKFKFFLIYSVFSRKNRTMRGPWPPPAPLLAPSLGCRI
jgi:hypothetical protein